MSIRKISLIQLVQLFSCSILLSACSVPYRLVSPPPLIAEDVSIKGADTTKSGVDAYAAFNTALVAASGNGAQTADFTKLAKEGEALIEANCARFFDRLGKIQQDLGFTRKETSLLGGFVSGALGLAGATPKAIANTGAAFGFTTASMDSYQDAYLFSPDVGAVQHLVRKEMEKFRTDNALTNATTYTQVVSLLSSYEALCQPHGIRNKVNQAVVERSK